MNQIILHELLDVCFLAKKITELMPALPDGMKPRHIHVIEIIFLSMEKKEAIRVVDVSHSLNITMPSVTKLIQELQEKQVITKLEDEKDKRSFVLSLTPLGLSYYEIYIRKYHQLLIELLSPIDEPDCQISISTLRKMYDVMISNPIHIADLSATDDKRK